MPSVDRFIVRVNPTAHGEAKWEGVDSRTNNVLYRGLTEKDVKAWAKRNNEHEQYVSKGQWSTPFGNKGRKLSEIIKDRESE